MGWSDEIDGYFRKPSDPNTDPRPDKARDSELLQETIAALQALTVKVEELARNVDDLRRRSDVGSSETTDDQTDLPGESQPV
jgi:hypothetical protein